MPKAEDSSLERKEKMLGLFVASSAIRLLSDQAAQYADQKKYHQMADFIRKASPYAITSIDLLNKLESNKRLSSLEKSLLEYKRPATTPKT